MRYFFIGIFVLLAVSSMAQQKKIYTTHRVVIPPVIDGKPDDKCWQDAGTGSGFIQREPNDGQPASQKTEFAVLYDDNYIYVIIKAFDTNPELIDKRMTRRDNMEGDLVGVHFDSYNDKLTSFSFLVNAAGVKSDLIFSNDGKTTDKNWNPIWWVKTSTDSLGWYAEIKIPLSQLRFSKNQNKIWGFEVSRYIYRLQELSLWEPIPQSSSGWVHKYGELHGISRLQPKRIIEVAPYLSGGVETYEKEEGNPFATGSDFIYRAGVDGKIGITNDFVLDFTINPDFGQVEADPSEVNLTAFETYFRERRPFFIEGGNILDYKIQPGEHESAMDNLFYSRRIGRFPQYYPEVADSEYVDMPNVTAILGALKITGKTKNGLSVGIMESLTREEKALIATRDKASERNVTVEPLTNYFVGRLQKDFGKGNTIVGGEFTSVNRSLPASLTSVLPVRAITGGADFAQYWKNRTYYFTAKAVAGNVSGDTAAIMELQTSPRRYFQRPDADYVNTDPSLSSLTGFGGNISAGKNTESGLAYSMNISWRSPGLELNDIGYLRVADKISQIFSVSYIWTKPTSVYRKINSGIVQWNGWDFGGSSIFHGGMFWVNTTFNNLYTLVMRGMMEYGIRDNFMLRGGPSFRAPGYNNFRINLETNNSRKFYMDFGTRQGFGQYGTKRNNAWDAGFIYRPWDALEFQFHPNFGTFKYSMQYVTETNYENEKRYILATIDQKTLRFVFRVDYNITPDLTIQYYGAPFISTGNYDNFKKVTNPQAAAFSDRYYEFSPDEIFYNEKTGSYSVDENRDGNIDYWFSNPDFDFKQFQSNLVLRWEYTPGSVIYLVWNQTITNYDGEGLFVFSDDMSALFSTIPHNVFLLKFSYRFVK